MSACCNVTTFYDSLDRQKETLQQSPHFFSLAAVVGGDYILRLPGKEWAQWSTLRQAFDLL